MDARDGGVAQAKTELDQLAFDMSTAYNATHSAGFGLDGVGGRNLFNAPAVALDAAKFMTLDAAIVGGVQLKHTLLECIAQKRSRKREH